MQFFSHYCCDTCTRSLRQLFTDFTRRFMPRLPWRLAITVPLLSLILVLTMSSCKLNQTPPNLYAMVYGIEAYDESITYNGGAYFPILNYTVDDAEDISTLLESKGYSVRLKTDSQATRQEFISDITYYKNNLSENDLLLIYFSGHGAQSYPLDWEVTGDEDQYSDEFDEYIIFYQEDDVYKNHALADTELYYQIKDIPAKKKVIIIDACHSGGFIGQEYDFDSLNPAYSSYDENRDNIFSSTLDAFFHPKSGDIIPSDAIVITAAGEKEVSWESSPHGMLTTGFLYAEQNGDYNNDGFLDTGELFRYTTAMMDSLWNSNWYAIQTQLLNDYGEYYTQEEIQFLPHISGGPVDYVLFETD